MRTNIDLDNNLMNEVMKISKAKTKKEAMNLVMFEYIRMEKMKEFAKLRGKISWEGNLNQMRQDRFLNE